MINTGSYSLATLANKRVYVLKFCLYKHGMSCALAYSWQPALKTSERLQETEIKNEHGT